MCSRLLSLLLDTWCVARESGMTVILDLSVTLAAPSPGAAPEVLASIALRCDALELSHRAICSLTPSPHSGDRRWSGSGTWRDTGSGPTSSFSLEAKRWKPTCLKLGSGSTRCSSVSVHYSGEARSSFSAIFCNTAHQSTPHHR